jgi:hypothetical protein
MKSVQTALRLPSEMHERLKKSGEDVSKEIRRRLEESFQNEDSYDEATRTLGDDVMELAALIQGQAKIQWQSHIEVHAAVRAAVGRYLELTAPVVGEVGTSTSTIRGFSPRERAETAGRMTADNFVHNRAARERKRAELKLLRQQHEEISARIAALENPEEQK